MRLSISKLPRPLGALLFSSFLAFQAGAASLPAGVTEAASIEGITEYRLSNGLRVLLVPDESKPSTTVNMTYLVGSRNEGYGESGMAHLLEHLLFRESKYLGQAEAISAWQRLGATFGSDANAETSPTQTVYKLDIPQASPEKLDETFKLLSGMITAPIFTDHGVKTDRKRVARLRREMGQETIWCKPRTSIPDDGHRKIRAVFAAEFFRNSETIVPRPIGDAAHLS